jgi:dTDP-glucose 4,6-dehydratase
MGRPDDDYELVADRAGHDQRYAIESGKLRLELGWQPRFGDLDRGLAETVAWYRAHRDWWAPHKEGTESAYLAKGQ